MALPDHIFPVGTHVPFTLCIVAKSEPGLSKEQDAWPTHELRQNDVDLALYQLVDICLQGPKLTWNAKRKGGAYMKATLGALEYEKREKKWEEGEGAPGRWIRTTIIKSTLRIEYPAEMIYNIRHTAGTADVAIKVRGYASIPVLLLRRTYPLISCLALLLREGSPGCCSTSVYDGSVVYRVWAGCAVLSGHAYLLPGPLHIPSKSSWYCTSVHSRDLIRGAYTVHPYVHPMLRANIQL